MRIPFICVLVLLVGTAGAQSTNFSAGPQYLITTSSSMFLQPIATPSLNLEASLPPLPSLPDTGPVVVDQSYTTNPALENQADLFPIYYGYPRVSEIELPSQPLKSLPASISDTGSANVPNAMTLSVPNDDIGEAASYWRAHKIETIRLYSNMDIEKLPAS